MGPEPPVRRHQNHVTEQGLLALIAEAPQNLQRLIQEAERLQGGRGPLEPRDAALVLVEPAQTELGQSEPGQTGYGQVTAVGMATNINQLHSVVERMELR